MAHWLPISVELRPAIRHTQKPTSDPRTSKTQPQTSERSSRMAWLVVCPASIAAALSGTDSLRVLASEPSHENHQFLFKRSCKQKLCETANLRPVGKPWLHSQIVLTQVCQEMCTKTVCSKDERKNRRLGNEQIQAQQVLPKSASQEAAPQPALRRRAAAPPFPDPVVEVLSLLRTLSRNCP